MQPELEDLLADIKYPIKALNRISQISNSFIKENYYAFVKNNCKIYIDEVIALNTAIQMIGYCMRVIYSDFYKEIDEKYQDNFTYDSVMHENL